MKRSTLFAGTAIAGLLAAGAANAGTLYIANLSAANENPPTTATFTGTGFLILNDAETSATIYATHNINIPLTGGHIHRGTATVNGPIIFPFPNPASPVGPLVWAIPAADVVNLKTLGLYMNFHTQVNPGGAIRSTLVRYLFAASATNASQTRVANALDISAGLNTDLDQLLMSGAVASAATRTQGLDDLSARTVYAQGRQAGESMAAFEENLFSHAEKLADEKHDGFGGYFSGGDEFGKRDTDVEQAGSKISRPFVLGGIDYGYDNGSTIGIGVGYADGEDKFKSGGGKTKAKTVSVLGHVAASNDQIAVAVVGGYGWTNFDTIRNLTSIGRTATSSHDGTVWSIGAKLSLPFELDNSATLAPYGMIDAQHAKVDAYTEGGASSAGLVVPELTDKVAAGEIGAMLTVPMGAEGGAVARLEAGWRYLLESGRESFAASLVGSPVTFQTNVLSPGRSGAHIAAELSSNLGTGVSGSIGYRGTISSRTSIHAVEARLTLRM